MPSLTGKPQLNRRVNRTLILDRIRANGQISRAELAKITEIRPPTVSAVVRELIEEGLVVETGLGETKGGRAPRMVALSCEKPQAIGFELTKTAVLGGLCDLKGDLRMTRRVPYAPQSPRRTLECLTALAEDLFAAQAEANGGGIGWPCLQGAGVALPGLIDTAGRVVRLSHPLDWRDVEFADLCEQRWDVPVEVVNDSAAGAMAAHFLSAGGCDNLVYLVLRFDDASHGVVGIGTGLVIHGEPYHGEFGAAGEITTPVAHPLTDARDEAGRPFADTAAYVAALQAGQPSAIAAMDRISGKLSLLLLHALNLLEPGRLIVESDVPELGEALWERLQKVLAQNTFNHESGRPEIVLSRLGDFASVRGAVVPTLKRVFKMPRWT